MERRVQMNVKESTLKRLKAIAAYGDSMDSVLNKLMDEHENVGETQPQV